MNIDKKIRDMFSLCIFCLYVNFVSFVIINVRRIDEDKWMLRF